MGSTATPTHAPVQVKLNPLDCDLNLDVHGDRETVSSLTENNRWPFGYMWGGVRGATGICEGKFYFRVRFVEVVKASVQDTDYLRSAAAVRIGISTNGSDLHKLGETPTSWAYCSGGGKAATGGRFTPYGAPFGPGDEITCLISLSPQPDAANGANGCSSAPEAGGGGGGKSGLGGSSRTSDPGGPAPSSPRGRGTISFLLNGQPQGPAFRIPPLRGPTDDVALFPHVQLRNARVVVSMGGGGKQGEAATVEGHKPWADALRSPPGVRCPVCIMPHRHLPNLKPQLVVMVGLPGSGKTHYARHLVSSSRGRTDARYMLLGTDAVLDQMGVLPLKECGQQERCAELLRLANIALKALMQRAACDVRRNYVLDQTNLNSKSRQAKVAPFIAKGFECKAVVMVQQEHQLLNQQHSQFTGCGWMLPDRLLAELRANFTVPAGEGFSEVTFQGLRDPEAAKAAINAARHVGREWLRLSRQKQGLQQREGEAEEEGGQQREAKRRRVRDVSPQRSAGAGHAQLPQEAAWQRPPAPPPGAGAQQQVAA